MDEWREVPANRLDAWADEVVAGLDAHEDVDRALRYALRRRPSLREENGARMADAVRAAALGLGPAACALAAGVSERLLGNWLARDASFAAAMAAARELAGGQGAGGRPGPAGPALHPAGLRVLLKALRAGSLHAPAAALIGLSGRALYRLRRESPEIAALVAAARRARPRKTDRRGGPGRRRYRLVRLDETALPSGSPVPGPRISPDADPADPVDRVDPAGPAGPVDLRDAPTGLGGRRVPGVPPGR
ncbi:hypothetical protein [Streptomyces yaizuensis]|uniref:Uncharacterized protein n=1 Tax=Streptomyces yaizuensis TaxID=2989713 RepID=A0ABQ5P2U0_9ACTN|nr:hypothetical protein [Streptomyces sp. YSPA8]GLF96918.1 hypothetical protein SYYSPA8_21495 [Streptomyces sp. YSPA8]